MGGIDLDAAACQARALLVNEHRQLPRQVANDVIAMAAEMVVHRELADSFENLIATADAERAAAARTAEMWKGKAEDGLGQDVTLRLVREHGRMDGCVVLTRRYPAGELHSVSNGDGSHHYVGPAVFHDCLTCSVTWEEGRG